MEMAAKVVGNDGQQHDVGYTVNIETSAPFHWMSDERPTGWNYRSDQPTYTSSTHAACGKVTIQSLEIDQDALCYFDGQDVKAQVLTQQISPQAQKQLLNPTLYSNLLDRPFQVHCEDMDPPEYDPEDDDPRNEYDPDDRDY